MDANGTRLYLILGEEDWGRCEEPGYGLLRFAWERVSGNRESGGFAWGHERHELTLRPLLFQFTAAPKDVRPELSNRRGAGRDRYGNWYWIDDSGRTIRVRSAGSGRTTHFWAPGDSEACPQPEIQPSGFGPLEPPRRPASVPLAGLAVTEDHYLVVGVLAHAPDPAGLLIFDLHAGGPPRQVHWPKPDEVPFEPFDMAPAPGGGVWILDRVHQRYWGLDRKLNVIPSGHEVELAAERPDAFQPLDRSELRRTARRTFPADITLADASLLAMIDPIAIEALPDGTVLILDYDKNASFSTIYRYGMRGQIGTPATTKIVLDIVEQTDGFTLVGYDMAFVPAKSGTSGEDRLYIVAADGNQAFAFRLTYSDSHLTLKPIAEYLPMRLFGGKGLVAYGQQAFYDFDDTWVPLVVQRRPRYVPQAELHTWIFDSREPQCTWHRLMIDGCIPPETVVQVWSRAADDEQGLALAEWRPEPLPRLRRSGSELPYLRQPSGEYNGTWELLLQRARGRYMQIRLVLSGNERVTPRLRALRAYYPRFSYLERYLPAVYREDRASASFLDRFLANFEGIYTALEDRIAAAQLLLDVRSAPAEALDWLASWFDVALDPAWDEARRRLFIAHAPEFFQARGTIRGLQIALRLALEPCANESIFAWQPDHPTRPAAYRIVEQYRTRHTPGLILGDPTAAAGPRLVELEARWQPEQGGADLHRRYTRGLWQLFLAVKYVSIEQLNQKHGQSYASLAEVPLPELPLPPGATRDDWEHFVSQQAASGGRVHFPVRDPGGSRTVVWQAVALATLGFVPTADGPDAAFWQSFLAQRYKKLDALNTAYKQSYSSFADVPLPIDQPAAGPPADDWDEFMQGLRLALETLTWLRWQEFLARRYRRISALNAAYGSKWAAFSAVPLPQLLPPDGAPLLDWYQFEAVVLEMHRAAHRFTVLVPTPLTELTDQAEVQTEQQRRLELARRIVELEKPAHTVFAVRYYWAMFRVGEVRLGDDTLIDQGSRMAFLAPPLALGQGYLGSAFLAPGHPQNVDQKERQLIVGRDQL